MIFGIEWELWIGLVIFAFGVFSITILPLLSGVFPCSYDLDQRQDWR